MNKVMDDAALKSADLQGRSLRKWSLFHTFMRGIKSEHPDVRFEYEGMEVGQWSASEFPVTPLKIRTFMWWLTKPCKDVNNDVESQSETDRFLQNAGPCGYSYTYVCVLSNNLLSFLEEKEWMEVEKGKYVIGGDITAIRREAAHVKKSIST